MQQKLIRVGTHGISSVIGDILEKMIAELNREGWIVVSMMPGSFGASVSGYHEPLITSVLLLCSKSHP